MNIFKKTDFLHLTNFKLLTPLMGKDFFFNFIIYARSDHLHYSAQALGNIAMPLVAVPIWKIVSMLPTL